MSFFSFTTQIREDEVIKWKQENVKLAKLQDSASRKYSSLEESRKEYEQQNLRLKYAFSLNH